MPSGAVLGCRLRSLIDTSSVEWEVRWGSCTVLQGESVRMILSWKWEKLAHRLENLEKVMSDE